MGTVCPGSPQDDVTAPELVITGGNEGGHEGVVFVQLGDALFLTETQRVSRKQFLTAKFKRLDDGVYFHGRYVLRSLRVWGIPLCFSKCVV